MKSRMLALLVGLVAGAMLLDAGAAAAQEGAIAGTVRSAEGQPLANVTIQVVDEDVGALTGADGTYRVEIGAGSYEVRASLIGFASSRRSVTVQPGETTELNFVLGREALVLGDVVATVAARDARRVELGSDIVRFDAEEAVEKSGAADLSELLNARATGVSIQRGSGTAGSASRIRIRGATSITQDNNPIIYVDGIRVSNATGTGPGSFDFGNGQTISRLDDIDPQEIESIQIQKGPTAAALYGSEAASGVIIIETRGGREGMETEFRYGHRQGFSHDFHDYWTNFASVTPFGITDVTDPLIQAWDPVENPVTGEIFIQHNPMTNPVTDPLRTGRSVDNRLAVRGAGEDVGYFASLRHSTEEGTLRNNAVERFSLRGNFNARPLDNLDISVSTGYIDGRFRLPDNDRSGVGMMTNAGAGLPLFSFGATPDGRRGECLVTALAGLPESLCEANQGNLTANFGKLETISNTQTLQRFIGSVNSTWSPFDWMTNRITVGVDIDESSNVNLVPLDPDRPFGADSEGLRSQTDLTSRVFTLDAATSGSWDVTDDLSLTTSLGTQVFRTRTRSISCEGTGGFASPGADACDAALTFSGGSNLVELYEVGGFLQQQVAFREYLFGTGAVRLDDHSALGVDDDLIVSPSASLSAVVSDMPFWNVDQVNNLRLRFAWGKAAQAPDPFAQDRTFEPIRVLLDGQQRIGVQPAAPGNPLLTAERNEEFEAGFDAAFANDRIGLNFTYFNARTTDAILPTNVAPSTGFTGTRFVNVGRIENEGIEISLNAGLVRRENVMWDVSVQLSTQDPVITDMGGEPPIIFGLGTDHQMFREGFSPGAYFAWEIESAERDAEGNITSVNLLPGNVNDPNRPNDRHIGRAFPGNEQSFSTTLDLFQSVRVFTLFDRAGSFYKHDLAQDFRSPFIPGTTTSREFAMRQAESTPEEHAAMEFSDFTRTGLFIQDASFVKWRELTVRYQLPAAVTDLFGPLRRASVTAGGRNLATITSYQGLDPESNFDGGRDTFNAAEFFTQPPGRTFFAQVDLVF